MYAFRPGSIRKMLYIREYKGLFLRTYIPVLCLLLSIRKFILYVCTERTAVCSAYSLQIIVLVIFRK